jgi:hypothetical protein
MASFTTVYYARAGLPSLAEPWRDKSEMVHAQTRTTSRTLAASRQRR